jgi:uncharacterized protein (DUF305 family)
MRNVHRPFGFTALAALALTSAACSGSQPASEPSTAQAAQHNQSDVDFVTGMAQHHQQALDLAGLVPDRSQNEQLKAIAARIHDEQAPEIEQFQKLEKEFGARAATSTPGPEASSDSMEGTDMGGMEGMVPENDVEQLRNLSGRKFDTRWIGLMAEHHNGAVKMAQNEIAKGQNPEAKQIARNIVTAQTAEVDELGALLQQISSEK